MSKIIEAFLENEMSIRRVIARYCPNADDIDELTQETFLKCFAAELKTEIHEPKGFLLRAAKNTAINETRKKRNTTTVFLEDSNDLSVFVDEGQISPETQLDSRKKLATLVLALSALSADDQQMVIMRKIENLKFKQIARRIGVSVNTVQRRVAAALLKCGSYLREQGYELREFGYQSSQESAPKGRTVSGPSETNESGDQ